MSIKNPFKANLKVKNQVGPTQLGLIEKIEINLFEKNKKL